MIRTLRNLCRLLGIARALARHDALFPLERLGVLSGLIGGARLLWRTEAEGRPGQRLAAALQSMGPTFIKIGQTLSTRPDLMGDEVAGDLSNLQDRLPPFAAADARAIIEAELGAPVDDLFAKFDDSPMAAASIAQVHGAVTKEGEAVAVKVLRPAIEAAFARDLDLLYWLAETVERAHPGWRRLRPRDVVSTFSRAVEIEMDMSLEAAAASELRDNLASDDGFRVPFVDWPRTARRILTCQRVGGIPIDERVALVDAGHDVDAILGKAARAIFNQVFRDGFFHADLHPGNLFVDEEGNIVAVDFGIMCRLDRKTRRYLAEMLLGFLTRDYRRVAEVHFEAGYVPANQSLDAFTQACRSIGEPILGRPAREISIAHLLAQLFRTTEAFAMETQPQLLLLQKNLLLAEGIGRRLNPEINIWQLAQPLIENWVADNLGPEARLRDGMAEGLDALQKLPRLASEAEAALAGISSGGLKLHPDTVAQLAQKNRRGNPLPWIVLTIIVVAIATVAL